MLIKASMKKFFLLSILIFSCFFSFGQLSKTHYLPPIAFSSHFYGFRSGPWAGEYIYISTPSTSSVTFNIKEVGGAVITGEVSNSNPYVYEVRETVLPPYEVGVNFPLPSSRLSVSADNTFDAAQIPPSETATSTSIVYSDKGYIIDATEPIYVAVRVHNNVHASALVSKGSAALGTTFRTGTFASYYPDFTYMNFVSIMATSDNTQVTINNIDEDVDILDFDEDLIGTNINGTYNDIVINLNRGQSYIVAVKAVEGNSEDPQGIHPFRTANGGGLIGTLISSDKPIVVNSGSMAGSNDHTVQGGRDFGMDQLVGIEKIGTEYIFVRGVGNNNFENVIIVAHEDNTEVFVNGSALSTVNSDTSNSFLNAGEYIILEGENYSAQSNMYVQASKPVYAFQGTAGRNSPANQAMFFVPPLKCSSTGDVNNIPIIDKIGSDNFTGSLNVVSKIGATITVSDLNNDNESIESLNVATKSGPFAVSGNASYTTYIISNLVGNVSIFSNDELYISYFNKNNFKTSGGFYSGFTSPPDAPTLTLNFENLGYCIPNVNLVAGDMTRFSTFEWWYDGGSGYSKITSATNQNTWEPKDPGFYKLRAYYFCPGKPTEVLDSPPVNISSCPPDFDGDGVIDNIDIDIDNDGIENIIDSGGFAKLDITDIYNPLIIVGSTTISNTISSTFEQISSSSTNTFVGGDFGFFTSTVYTGSEQKSIYTLASSSTLNLNFIYQPAINHNVVSGESYIIKVNSPSKTISLNDPSGQLLIDSNYDGSYTSGLASLTLNEIRFKFNPSPSGILPFSFRANQIDGFVFTHELSNNSSSSIFNGSFSLTHHDIDTDLDGVFDSKDLDSDEDGCSDTLEAGFTDSDADDILGVSPVNVNSFGKVLSQGGYLIPLDEDSNGVKDFQELVISPQITSQPLPQEVCLGNDGFFSVSSNSTDTIFQWQSTDSIAGSPTITWTDLVTNSLYQGVTTNQLNIVSPTVDMSGLNYRVVLRKVGLVCPVYSNPAQMDVGASSFVVSTTNFTINEGSTATSTLPILLSSKPLGQVVFNINNPDETEVSILSSTTITFTPENWNIPQNIVFSGVLDGIKDGNIDVPISFIVNDELSEDCYDDNPDTIIIFKVIDLNCTVSSVVPILDISENTLTNTFSIVLDAEPNNTSSVVFDITSSDPAILTLDKSQITFTNLNWDIPQVINAIPVDNDLADGNKSVTIVVDINEALTNNCYKTLDAINYNINISDDEVVGYTVSPVQGKLLEASTQNATFTIVLDGKPNAEVKINILPVDNTEVIADLFQISFNKDNWNIPQVITLADVDEFINDGDQNTEIIISVDPTSDANFVGLSNESVFVITENNDFSGIDFISIDNLTDENGDTGSFGIKLKNEPTETVKLFISSTKTDEGTVQEFIEFDASNWDDYQVITVTGIDDNPPISDGAQDYKIIFDSISSLDLSYHNLDLNQYEGIDFINQDNDAPGIILSVLNDDTKTDEYGGTVVIQFELLAKPNLDSDVTIPISLTGEIDEMKLDESSITIKAENWNNSFENEIVIFGLDDLIIDGPQPVTFVTGDPVSIDPQYDSMNANDVADVSLLNEDNDKAGIIVSIPDKVSEDLTFTELTVSLATEITEDVFIDISLDDSTELSVNLNRIEFSPDDANNVKKIIVTGVDDTILDGSIASLVIFEVDKIFSEHVYTLIDPVEVIIINDDNEKDQDSDGIIDQFDNCISVSNSNQLDSDNDGIGDVCDQPDPEPIKEEEKNEDDFFIPNAFSPDGDGVNDTWVIDGLNQFPNNSISIYNRWEEKVYEIIGYQNDWRGIGNISSNSVDLPDGVYYYVLDLGNGSPLVKGFIYIKRRR